MLAKFDTHMVILLDDHGLKFLRKAHAKNLSLEFKTYGIIHTREDHYLQIPSAQVCEVLGMTFKSLAFIFFINKLVVV